MLVLLVAAHMGQLPSVPCDVVQLARRAKLSAQSLAMVENIEFTTDPRITEVDDLVGLYKVTSDFQITFPEGDASIIPVDYGGGEGDDEAYTWLFYGENLQGTFSQHNCTDKQGVSSSAKQEVNEPLLTIIDTSLPWAFVMFALSTSDVRYQVITGIVPPDPFTTTINKEIKNNAAITWDTVHSAPSWVPDADLSQATLACNSRNDHNELEFIFFEQVVNDTKESSGTLQLQFPNGTFFSEGFTVPAVSESPSESSSGISTGATVGIAVGCIAVLILVAVFYLRRTGYLPAVKFGDSYLFQ